MNNSGNPLVTIVCLCYNHAKFVEESLFSVINQTYQNIELIIVDDASPDNSQEIIRAFAQKNGIKKLVLNTQNLGNCKSFNKALKSAKGKYIIDLAADDILLPNSVERQVDFFEQFDEKTAVVFSNGADVDENRKLLNYFFPVNKDGKSKIANKTGDLYRDFIAGNRVINATGVMMRTSNMRDTGGYNESAAYEDIDYWFRTSRNYLFHYNDAILCEKRRLTTSLAFQFNLKDNKLLSSALNDFRLAFSLNKSKEEDQLLKKQIRRYLWRSILVEDYESVPQYIELLRRTGKNLDIFSWIMITLFFKLKIPIYWFFKILVHLRTFVQNKLTRILFPTKSIHLWQNSSDFTKRILTPEELKGWSNV
jgi:glycosyltransferase involved in cell wall biosynthesis